MITIGIPNALFYYEYYPMWKTFFEELGAKVAVSPPTTRAMLPAGSSRVVADTCLPVKVFLGHVLSLVDKCDFIFIPAVRSMEKRVYNCSKFLGLPDMTRAVIPELPPILDIDVDINKGRRVLLQAIYKLGRHFTWDLLKVRRAGLAAWQAHLEYKRMMSSLSLTPPQAIDRLFGSSTSPSEQPASLSGQATIAVIGHSYLLYDEHINYRLISRLEQAGYRILTPEMVTAERLKAGTAELVGSSYWAYEEEVVGAGEYYLESGIDGIIGIMTFGCAPDSLMMDMVRRQAARFGRIPFMNLTLEEHTAEAGLITRLEAFIDMIERKKRQAAVCV